LQQTSDQPSAFGLEQSVMNGVPSATEQRPTRPAITSATEFQPSQVSTGETRRRQQGMSNRGIKPDREEIGCYKQAQPTESCLGTTDDGQLTTDAAEFSLFNPLLESLAALSGNDFRRIFRHSPIKRVKYPGWLRNLCVAMGNSGDPRFIPALRGLSQHADPIVREHAAWALACLQPS